MSNLPAMKKIGLLILFCIAIIQYWAFIQLNLNIDLSKYIPNAEGDLPNSLTESESNNADVADENEAYLEWLQEARNESLHLSPAEEPIRVNYRAMSGLGHQLCRLASLYHLSMVYQLPRIWPTQNPYCGDINATFNHLIGEGPILVDVPFFGGANLFRNQSLFPRPNRTIRAIDNSTTQHVLKFVNDVPGYEHGRGSFNIDKYLVRNKFFGKDITDYQFYNQFMLLFEQRHKSRIEKFFKTTRFQEHTVFGLHIRAGNGEGGDFAFKRRGMQDLDGWIERVVSLLCDYKGNHSQYFTEKPLMIYVGTDTGSVIPKLHAASNATCQIPFISSDQTFLEEGAAVGWNKNKRDDANDEDCVKRWEDMVLDMYIFTRCNTVLAGTYSSFTQSAPLSFMMHKAKQQLQHVVEPHQHLHPHYFCDVGVEGNRMDCSRTLIEWMRQTPTMTWGDVNATKHRTRHEIQFPILEKGAYVAVFFYEAGLDLS